MAAKPQPVIKWVREFLEAGGSEADLRKQFDTKGYSESTKGIQIARARRLELLPASDKPESTKKKTKGPKVKKESKRVQFNPQPKPGKKRRGKKKQDLPPLITNEGQDPVESTAVETQTDQESVASETTVEPTDQDQVA